MPADLQFSSKNSSIKGNLGTQFVNCTLQIAGQGTLPPAGNYQILLHPGDPAYGPVAVLGPAGSSQGSVITSHWWIADYSPSTGMTKISPSADTRTSAAPRMSALDASMKGSAITTTWVAGGLTQMARSPQVFVLSDKRIPGRNNLIVSNGFSDLLSALQKSGGASVTVS